MIRPVTCICMLLAGVSGLYLYQEKHRVQMLDRQIEGTVRASQAARERTGVLRAEWTLMNDPERLQQLADRFLTLKTVAPGQFTTMAELDKRLPPVRDPNKAPETAAPAAVEPTPDVIADKSEPSVSKPEHAVAEKPAQPPKVVAEKPPAPQHVASLSSKGDRASEKADRSAEKSEKSARLKESKEPKGSKEQVLALAKPPVATHSVLASAASLPRPVPVAEAVSRPAERSFERPAVARVASNAAPEPPQQQPIVTSALGMARTSAPPPPVPVSRPPPAYNEMNGN